MIEQVPNQLSQPHSPSSPPPISPTDALSNGIGLLRGPWLHSPSDCSMTVRWSTAAPSASSVWVGEDVYNLTLVFHDPAPVTEHLVELVGFRPDTRYYYQVGELSTPIGKGSNDLYFQTPPPLEGATPIRGWVAGDRGRDNHIQSEVLEGAMRTAPPFSPAFWILLGDNAYDNGTAVEYQRAVFDRDRLVLSRSGLFPTEGNHDAKSSRALQQTGPYYDWFTVPTHGELGGVPSGTAAYYSFDVAHAHIISFNSTDALRLHPDQIDWLERDLKAADARWKILFLHHPPYTKGSHDSDREKELCEIRRTVLPILEQYGVDLVLAGHSHSYERTPLIHGHYGDSSSFSGQHLCDPGVNTGHEWIFHKSPTPGEKGTLYCVIGTSGKADPLIGRHEAMQRALSIPGSLFLDIAADTLSGFFVDVKGAVVDQFTIIKATDPHLMVNPKER